MSAGNVKIAVDFIDAYDKRNPPAGYDCANAVLDQEDEIVRLQSQLTRARAALSWYAERAAAISKKLEAFKGGGDLDYVMAVLTELALDGGRRGSAHTQTDPS